MFNCIKVFYIFFNKFITPDNTHAIYCKNHNFGGQVKLKKMYIIIMDI